MEIKISKRLESIRGYAFAEVDNEVAKLRQQGISPIDFGVGDPQEPTPEIIRNALKKGADIYKSSGYPSYAGNEEYRKEIAAWHKRRFGVTLDFEKEITSTIGAKEAVFNFPEAFINPGDYVISPNPGYPPYGRGTLFAEGRSYLVPMLKENNFLMDLSIIPKEIVKKSRILWINYPHNPTGAMATEEFFKEAVDFGHDNNIIIASDECYTEIYYSKKPNSILEYSKEGVVSFQSLSKRSAMTGYRIGWVAGDEKIIAAFRKLKTNIDSGTPNFVQEAAIAALKDETHVERMRSEYKKKKEILIDSLVSAGLRKSEPDATIYVWQEVPKSSDSVKFAKKLLQKEVALVVTPGEWVSSEVNGINPGKNYVRFALVPTIEQTIEAAKRIKRYLKQ